jgi:plasmid maintenance system antidote protein VapI
MSGRISDQLSRTSHYGKANEHARGKCFTAVSPIVNDLRPSPPHPIDIIWAELDARGWRVSDLAARMGDDPLKSRALLFHYLHHPTRELELGRMWCDRLDQAFGLGSDFFLNLEKAWREVRRRNGPRDCLCSV